MTDEVGHDYEITEDELDDEYGERNYWNYRLVRKDGMIGIHEVYYTDGVARACTVEPCRILLSEDEDEPVLDSLRQMLQWIQDAFNKPVLDYDAIPEEGAEGL